jgi:hypothetical protein
MAQTPSAPIDQAAGRAHRRAQKAFDLEDRLLDFAARVLRLVEHFGCWRTPHFRD